MIIFYFIEQLFLILALIYTNNLWDEYEWQDWVSAFLGFTPILTIELLLGFPPARNTLTAAAQAVLVNQYYYPAFFPTVLIILLSFIIPICWCLTSVFYLKLNPLALVYISLACWGALQIWWSTHERYTVQSSNDQRAVSQGSSPSARAGYGITTADVLLFLMLFVPLDLRWYYNGGFYEGPDGLAFDWWACAITVLCLLGLLILRPSFPGFGYRLIPSW